MSSFKLHKINSYYQQPDALLAPDLRFFIAQYQQICGKNPVAQQQSIDIDTNYMRGTIETIKTLPELRNNKTNTNAITRAI